jgi:DNA repair exonuclease SbcCD ATPase subunit
MELTEILDEIGEEKAAIINAAIEAEKNRGIEASRKKGEDVKKFMTVSNKLKDSLRALNIDPDGNLEEQISEARTRIEKLSKESEGGNDQVKSLQKQMADILKKLEASEKEKETVNRKLTTTKLSESLSKAFGDSIYGVDLAVKDLITSGVVKLSDGDKVVFLDGDNEIDLDEGVNSFKKKRPDLVKNTQKSGGGSSPQQGKGVKVISQSEYDSMNVAQRAAFFASGGSIT